MIQGAFEKLLGKIGVSQFQISRGSTSHQYVRGLLDNKWKNDSSFPWLTDGDFLSGSYARGTKIHPLDDIDVMMVIDGTGLFVVENGQQANAEVRGSGSVGSPVHTYTYGTTGLISSKMILEKFRDAIKEAYPNSSISKDGQAINVWLESYNMGIDIVPCFHVLPKDGTKEFYFIPQGGESHEWLKTNPKIDTEIVDGLDERHDKKFKSVVRLIKHWNEVHNNSRLKSYHLETIASCIFHNHPNKITDYHTALQYFFNNAGSYVQNSCSDMTGIGGVIDSYLTLENRNLTLQKIEQVRQQINPKVGLLFQATNQLSGWKKIYGDTFGL